METRIPQRGLYARFAHNVAIVKDSGKPKSFCKPEKRREFSVRIGIETRTRKRLLTVQIKPTKLPGMNADSEEEENQRRDEKATEPIQEVPPPKLRDLRAERDPMGAGGGGSSRDRNAAT